MSQTPGQPDRAASDGAGTDQVGRRADDEAQPIAEQPYDVPGGVHQYGQPPATGYQPPATDPPGQSAAVQGPGPQQYGQPEHGQASYEQEGFPGPTQAQAAPTTSEQPPTPQSGQS